MKLICIVAIGLLSSFLIGCGSVPNLERSNSDSSPQFELAYNEYKAGHFDRAGRIFSDIAIRDTFCHDPEACELWSQCLVKLGLVPSGHAVLEVSIKRIQLFAAANPNSIAYSDAIEEMKSWDSSYPKLPGRFLEENGFVPYNRDPSVIHQVAPEYPASELGEGVSGVVWVCANVDTSGNVIDAWAKQYPSTGTRDAALAAIKQFRFLPYKLKGTLARCTVTVPFRFAASN